MKLYLFTDSFPHGLSETFLENELPFLSTKFDAVIIIPLYKKAEIRSMPSNVKVWNPIIKFNPKVQLQLLICGMLNFSPIGFALKEFFNKKIYSNPKWIWNFFTSLLLFRAIYSNRSTWKKLVTNINHEDKLYFYWADKSALMLPFLKQKIQNTSFVRFHRTDLYEYAKGGYIPFRTHLFPAIDWFLPISEDGKNYLNKTYTALINEDKIRVCRLGVFDHGINPGKNDGEVFQLVSCSYMVPVKRISLIINALRELSLPIKWTHIGTGEMEKQVKELIKSLPTNIEVELKGAVSNTEVLEYYKKNHVDLFINVSASEGVPVSIMEVQSFGIPCIATNVGGTAEIVDNAVGKLLVTNISAYKISKIIQYLYNQDLEETRNNARSRWNESCNAEKNYTEFVDFISETGR